MSSINHPILVISYNEDSRAALVKSVIALDIDYVEASSFVAAEDIALGGIFNGILVDLPSIVKAKDEEKIVACSLTGFYPTLRVRTMGGMLIPMTMPGEARQDSSLKDFIIKSCHNFVPRRLRTSRRKDMVISTTSLHGTQEDRGFTLNLSWGGAFIADVVPEKFQIDQQFTLYFHKIETKIAVRVCWIQPWGDQKRPGIGVQFLESNSDMDEALQLLLNHTRDACKDRMVMR